MDDVTSPPRGQFTARLSAWGKLMKPRSSILGRADHVAPRRPALPWIPHGGAGWRRRTVGFLALLALRFAFVLSLLPASGWGGASLLNTDNLPSGDVATNVTATAGNGPGRRRSGHRRRLRPQDLDSGSHERDRSRRDRMARSDGANRSAPLLPRCSTEVSSEVMACSWTNLTPNQRRPVSYATDPSGNASRLADAR